MMSLNAARWGVGALLVGLMVGCPSDTDEPGETGGSSSGSSGIATASDSNSTTSGGTDSTTMDTMSGTTASTTADPTAGTGSGTDTETGGVDPTTDTANDPSDPLDCGGTTYACGDGMDNDGDGKTDLDDPECTGPCDDDESSFATGIPGDNMDCKQDCFFDGNSGQGDDKCLWNLKCDPENPGADINCEYTGGNNCANSPPNQNMQCIDYCSPFVPPGCDCFGCCTVLTDMGEVNIFLNSSDECSLDNLDACQSCTPNESCGNTCAPEECELCFGQDPADLPPECDGGNACENDLPCQQTSDCPTDFFCYLDCCYPPPPG
jgi:hypothetical protein